MSLDLADPTISVVIPAYNAEATLARTLESALGQTWRRLEVAVVDDGSSDRTTDIAADYAHRDQRVRLIRQANAGVVRARNAGILATRGELIAPLDADDLWAPAKLERQLRRMREAGPDCGVVYCWSADIDEGDQVIVRRLDVDDFEGDVLAPMIVTNFIGNASAPLIRRDVFASVGFWDEKLGAEGGQGCADWLAFLELAAVTRFALEPAFLVGYRQAAGQMSRDLGHMRRAYDLVVERIRAAHPAAPRRLLKWSQAAFDIYLWELSGFSRMDLLFRSVAADPSWLMRWSTRTRFRRWLAGRLSPEAAPASGGLAPEHQGDFYAMDVERERVLGDGRLAQARRRTLAALRV